MVEERLLRLPFDHYGRYRLAADVVEATRRSAAASTVLDVGGGPGSLAAFCRRDRIVSSDLRLPGRWHQAAPSLVLADGGCLPFPDDCFDVVVTLDTLEHVPAERRAAVLDEVVRVARGWALVVCPCATAGVAEADAALLSVVRERFGEQFETVAVLTEHLRFGHPEPEMVLARLRAAGAQAAQLPSGRLDRWLPMMVLFYALLALGHDEPVELVQAWYNRLYYHDDLRAPSYRQAFLARLPRADGPALDELVAQLWPSSPSPAPDAGAFAALRLALGDELALVADRRGAEVAALRSELTDVRRRLDEQARRAEAAEQRAAALAVFRDDVLSHPLVRLRSRARRVLGLRG